MRAMYGFFVDVAWSWIAHGRADRGVCVWQYRLLGLIIALYIMSCDWYGDCAGREAQQAVHLTVDTTMSDGNLGKFGFLVMYRNDPAYAHTRLCTRTTLSNFVKIPSTKSR